MERLLPSYPLWIIDPNFSIWTGFDCLNEGDASFWTGLSRKTYGLVYYNGIAYSFLGLVDGTKKIKQESVSVSAFGTKYVFISDDFKLVVEFVSPLLLTDLSIMSCPVCYTRYKIIPKNNLPDDFSISLVLDEEYCYNKEKADVMGGVLPLDNFEVAFMTRKRNLMMSNSYDRIAPDYGDIYLSGKECWFISEEGLTSYLKTGVFEYINNEKERKYIVGTSNDRSGFFMTGFDDRVSIFYFGEWLKCYFFEDDKTIIDALNYSYINSQKIFGLCEDFDKKLKADADNIGSDYYLLTCASLRQSVGAHKLVKNRKGELLFLSKECASNGCIGTVDVTYPAMPLYLLYNPELVNAMIRGIFDFARKDVWTFDFAPHDLGVYPWCLGQVYGLNNVDNKYSCNLLWPGEIEPYVYSMLYLRPAKSNIYDINKQMPVEECGNMLIIVAAALRAGGSKELAINNFDLLEKWVLYLEKYGLKPENQLCTDDFAGHLSNNVNLAIKALVGIESFSIICDFLEEYEKGSQYRAKAIVFADKLKEMVTLPILPLSYDLKDSYSLKYNILFDKLFGFNLIGNEICERETSYYLEKNNYYGVPLDIRENYTKSDWILWVATLTENKEKREALYKPVINFLKYSEERKPFSDWFGTTKGEIHFFINRSVQGGIFAPLLKESNKLNK